MWCWPWPAAALWALAPDGGGRLRLTLAPPAAAFGPFAPFAPVWSVAVGPGPFPSVAAGVAFGPVALALRLAGPPR